MATLPVRFRYITGVPRRLFRRARLVGSWNESGYPAERWTEAPMREVVGEDGCPTFEATVRIDTVALGLELRWTVIVDGPGGDGQVGITTEVGDLASTALHRTFTLKAPRDGATQVESYYLTHVRRLGAQKRYPPGAATPGIEFAVWAPNARAVELVFGRRGPTPAEQTGYIADDGNGIEGAPIPMRRDADGVFHADQRDAPELAAFGPNEGRLYMFRITKDDGQIAYRTDLHSRCQIGEGRFDPRGARYTGPSTELDGRVSCSVVVDPDTVGPRWIDGVPTPGPRIAAEVFWRDELDPSRPLPKRVEDLVIYELHTGSLGFGRDRPGTFEDAIALCDHLTLLGVNALELLPVLEFAGDDQWGYATSHYFAVEHSLGCRDGLKHLVRECHRRGIVVIIDLVINHYDPDAERAEWMFDTNTHERSSHYWYEGSPGDYRDYEALGGAPGHGGYLDNGSTGYAPRYHEEMVRKLFTSSAVALLDELHVDGFRLDLTTAIHRDNRLHADGRSVDHANAWGARMLREICRTLRLVRPDVLLIAEDHSEWDAVTRPASEGGLGFDAAWYAAFYHHLIGDGDRGPSDARLLYTAGFGDDRPLAMGFFAGALAGSAGRKVVYAESHDEAGNTPGSHRNIVVAAGGAPLVGATRRYAEARCRFAFGMAALSAGTPMFLMGEEVGAKNDMFYRDTSATREDIVGLRDGEGAGLFRCYRDLILLRASSSALRSRSIAIVHTDDVDRTIAFLREDAGEALLVVASLNNRPFVEGYRLDGPFAEGEAWTEIFNSDAAVYGGDDVGNQSARLTAQTGSLRVIVPANGVVVLRRGAVSGA